MILSDSKARGEETFLDMQTCLKQCSKVSPWLLSICICMLSTAADRPQTEGQGPLTEVDNTHRRGVMIEIYLSGLSQILFIWLKFLV